MANNCSVTVNVKLRRGFYAAFRVACLLSYLGIRPDWMLRFVKVEVLRG